MPNRSRNLKKNLAVCAAMAFASLAGTACSSVEDPEDPGFNKPAVTGVLDGEISNFKDYGAALEKENYRANHEGHRWNDGFSDDF